MKSVVFTAVAATLVSTAAHAAPVTPFLDAANSAQGQSCEYDTATMMADNCTAVAASRSNILSIDEGVAGFYSLGLGGTLSFDVSPMVFDNELFALEITGGAPNPNFPEAARFEFSGPDGIEFIEVATFGDAVRSASGGVSVTRTLGSGSYSFNFDLNGLSFDSLTITDRTFGYFASTYDNRTSDGFDVGELVFDAVDVPAPGALGLLGLGLLALGARRTRS